jgi:hypothetical protein
MRRLLDTAKKGRSRSSLFCLQKSAEWQSYIKEDYKPGGLTKELKKNMIVKSAF